MMPEVALTSFDEQLDMAPIWIDRMVRGPEKEFMDRAEFRKLFGISEDVMDQFLQTGVLPAPIRPTKRTVLFSWQHAVMLNLWMQIGGRVTETDTGTHPSLI